MALIELTTIIHAPIARCFDLARSIDLHKLSTGTSNEEVIAGKTSGLIGLNEFVTWRATHLGIRQNLTSKITGFTFPVYFRDEMLKGAFKSIYHEHFFEEAGEQTLMKDLFTFELPFGLLGKGINTLFLKNHLYKLLLERNLVIKRVAESDEWKTILPNHIK